MPLSAQPNRNYSFPFRALASVDDSSSANGDRNNLVAQNEHMQALARDDEKKCQQITESTASERECKYALTLAEIGGYE